MPGSINDFQLLELLDAARHTKPVGRALDLLAMHTTYSVIAQAKNFEYAFRIYTFIGRNAEARRHKVFDAAQQALPGCSLSSCRSTNLRRSA